MTQEIEEEEGTGIEETTTDKKNCTLMKVLAGMAGEVTELRELRPIAIGGTLQDTARGFLTWGILLQVTL